VEGCLCRLILADHRRERRKKSELRARWLRERDLGESSTWREAEPLPWEHQSGEVEGWRRWSAREATRSLIRRSGGRGAEESTPVTAVRARSHAPDADANTS
jgi:hypothetical protein